MPLKSNGQPGTILGTGYGFAKGGTGICVATEDRVLWVTVVEDDNGCEYSNRGLYELDLKGRFTNE